MKVADSETGSGDKPVHGNLLRPIFSWPISTGWKANGSTPAEALKFVI